MILVTGATGTIGSAVLRILSTKDVLVRAMGRDPERVQAGAGRGTFAAWAADHQAAFA